MTACSRHARRLAFVAVCTAASHGPRAAPPPDPRGVTTLDVACAKAVVARQAAQPSVAAAEPWSNLWKHAVLRRAVGFTSWVGRVELPGIEALDSPDAVAIAEALIAHSQPVALPILRRITKPALGTLKRKPDIRLPARDAIHVVPTDVRKR